MADAVGTWESYFFPPPDDRTMRNVADIRDPVELSMYEYVLTAERQRQLDADPSLVQRTYDAAHMRAIHAHLFQDVYEWAGQYRTVDMVKAGSQHPFALTGEIDGYLERAADLVATTRWESLDREGFAEAAAAVYVNVNHAHPFREGNGRAAKVFMEHVAERSPFTLDYSLIEPRVWNMAASLSAPDLHSSEPVVESMVPVFYGLAQPRESPEPAVTSPVERSMALYRASFPQPAREATRGAPDAPEGTTRRAPYGPERGRNPGRGR